jgi:hypothetical protein
MFEKQNRKMGYIFPKRIKQIMNGETPVIKVGWTSKMENGEEYKPIRKIGDRWTDENGKEWEQREGYVVSINNLRDLIKDEIKCPRCNKYLDTKLDKKFIITRKTCYECVLDFETFLKTRGQWDDYQRLKMRTNALSFLQDSKDEITDYLNNIDAQHHVTEDGKIEKWTGDTSDVKKFFNQELIDIENTKKEMSKELDDIRRVVDEAYEEFEKNEYYNSRKDRRRRESSGETTEEPN